MSHTAAISYRSGRDSRIGRWMTCATSPRPMTPTRNLLTCCLTFGGELVDGPSAGGARGRSALGGARDEAAGQGPLKEEEEDEHGQGRQGAGGHDVAPLRRELLDEAVQAQAERELAVRGEEDVGEEELVPGQQEREDRHGDDAGPGQRHDDVPQRLKPARAVDERGLLDLSRDAIE